MIRIVVLFILSFPPFPFLFYITGSSAQEPISIIPIFYKIIDTKLLSFLSDFLIVCPPPVFKVR